MNRFVILIPSFKPGEQLSRTVAGLQKLGFSRFVVVDDGSGAEFARYFEPLRQAEGIAVVRHKQNRGKGAALKSGLFFIFKNAPDAACVITVDADGQHDPNDVLRVAKEAAHYPQSLILGSRDFSLPQVPKRSRFGNRMTSTVFRWFCGLEIGDTQTGLRAIPAKRIPQLLKISGDRYEYETHVLLHLKKIQLPLREVKIKTVYYDENSGSHFRPVRDSLRIYGLMIRFWLRSIIRVIRFSISSLVCTLVDAGLFFLFHLLFSPTMGLSAVFPAQALARLVSSALNFILNRNVVFRKQRSGKTLFVLARYYAVAVPLVVVSASLIAFLELLSGAGHSMVVTLLKLLVDGILFIFSYRLQRDWVFQDERTVKKTMKSTKSAGSKLSKKTIFARIGICFLTLVFFLVGAVYAFLYNVVNGPSPSFRDRLVLSALEGSATKWLPNLFLPQSVIDEISTESRNIVTDSLSMEDYTSTETGDTQTVVDEWANCPDEGIRVETVAKNSFTAYVMLVRDPKRVFLGPTYDYASAGSGKQIFQAVEMEGALAAINGGEFSDYGGGGSGAQPMGLTYSKGKCVWNEENSSTFMGFDKNDRLIVKNGMTRAEADSLGIRDGCTFGGQEGDNVLITNENGEVKFHYVDGDTAVAQRTAIGQRADGTVIMIVTDGRSASSIGASRNDLVDLFREYSAVSAGRLDGGSSAMMYYEDYATKYNLDPTTLNETQKQGMVNVFKAFTGYRYIPTYFMVRPEEASK